MDEHSEEEYPLLLSKEDYDRKKRLLVSCARSIIKFTMWVIFVAWATFLFLYPSDFVYNLFSYYLQSTAGSLFGITGSTFLAHSAPILVLAFLAIAHLILTGEEDFQGKTSKPPRFRLWTFPVIVDGPLGVVSAAELIGILLFSAFIIWAVSEYTIEDFSIASAYQLTFKEFSILMLELTGLRFGLIGMLCLTFLFLPIARGSVLLRHIGIPFEHATRYHVWLGHLTMAVFTLHGLFFIVAWALDGCLLQESDQMWVPALSLTILIATFQLLKWSSTGVANLAGVISLTAGLFMWVTSLRPVRRQNFELFFYTHQLYIVFLVFLALHVGDFVFSMAAGGIFLFILDRFLRFCQSRTTVNVISASSFPCGTVQLVVSKPANLQYNALSFIFIKVQELSWLQWHPFSVSSSPLDGKYHISILTKVLGEWTSKLRGRILDDPKEEPQLENPLQPHSNLTVSVEGPYGHESPYHLAYENLILVAGGIGISPFLAILSDILHRINSQKPCLPKNILVVWAVKQSNELSLLYSLDIESICPKFDHSLNLEIQTYVTRETEPQLEEGQVIKSVNSFRFPPHDRCGISVLVGTGNIFWSGIYVMASTVGLVLSFALLQIFYINPFGITCWWYKGLLFVGCMVASPVIFGGVVIGLWHLWERKTSAGVVDEDDVQKVEPMAHKESSQDYVATSNAIRYGCRPDFKEIFGSISERWGHVNVGVIVCGPPTLQSSVAKECRSQTLKRRCNQPIFHFNSHSFDL